jgi:hypothetical protein
VEVLLPLRGRLGEKKLKLRHGFSLFKSIVGEACDME